MRNPRTVRDMFIALDKEPVIDSLLGMIFLKDFQPQIVDMDDVRSEYETVWGKIMLLPSPKHKVRINIQIEKLTFLSKTKFVATAFDLDTTHKLDLSIIPWPYILDADITTWPDELSDNDMLALIFLSMTLHSIDPEEIEARFHGLMEVMRHVKHVLNEIFGQPKSDPKKLH